MADHSKNGGKKIHVSVGTLFSKGTSPLACQWVPLDYSL